MGYADVYAAWQRDPEAFWIQAAEAIDWVRKPTKALNDARAPLYEWYSDGLVNTCWNAVDRHVEAGRGEQAAILYDSPLAQTGRAISYAELRHRVAILAGALKAKGIAKGDRVIIYMPMIPEALEAMLACARLGAIHSVVFGGFEAHELAVRIDDCTPKAIIAASCGLEPGRTILYKPLARIRIHRLKATQRRSAYNGIRRRLPVLAGQPRRLLARPGQGH
jgi:propionyl-CoA synthetase